MSGLIEHVERAEIARWEAVLNEEPHCDLTDHGGVDASQSKFHSGPAAFASKAPCGNHHVVCRAFRDAVWYVGVTVCYQCGEEHGFLDMTWVEL